MKKKIFILLISLITLTIFSQNDSIMIFNIRTIGADSVVHYFDEAGLRTTRGRMDVQIRFDSMNCLTATFDAGSSLIKDHAPAYPVSYSEISFPIALDTTKVRPSPNESQLLFGRYLIHNKHDWTFMCRYDWDRGWNVYTVYTGTCTRGRIWRIR